MEDDLVMKRTKLSKDSLMDIRTFYKIALACVYDRESGYMILFGPIRISEIMGGDLQKFYTELNFKALSPAELQEYFSNTPLMPMENLLTYISQINIMINRDFSSVTNVLQTQAEASNDAIEIERAAAISTSDMKSKDFHNKSHIDYENALCHFIANGMLEELEKMNHESWSLKMSKLGPTYMRSLKNSVLIMAALCNRAAVQGGLNASLAQSLEEQYAQHIELTNSVNQLASLANKIRKDYCMRVRSLTQEKISSPMIRRAVRYIDDHIYEKLSATDLADYLGLSLSYVSVKFKEEMVCTIPQYIARRKVDEAKVLLQFTERSLVEISNMLSFSSQSHFQNQFRKVTGITPNQYRHQKK